MLGIVINSIAFITYFYFGLYILFLETKSTSNFIFFILCVFFSLWSFSYIFINFPMIAPEQKMIWQKIGYTTGMFFEPLLIIFALHFSNFYKNLTFKLPIIIVLFILAFIFQYQNWANNAIADDRLTGFWYITPVIFNTLCNCMTLAILIEGALKTNSNRHKLQIKIIVIGGIIAIVCTLFSEYYKGAIDFSIFTPAFLCTWIASAWYALVKHRFLAINQDFIYQSIIKYIDEIIVILDPHNNILAANTRFLTLNKLTEDTIKEKPIFDFLHDTTFRNTLISMNQRKKEFASFKLNLGRLNNNPALFNMQLQLMIDKYDDILGILLIGREVTGIDRLKTIYGISNREINIIKHVLTGSTNKQIADLLYITESTVKAHLTSIYNKIGIDNKVQLLNVVNDN